MYWCRESRWCKDRVQTTEFVSLLTAPCMLGCVKPHISTTCKNAFTKPGFSFIFSFGYDYPPHSHWDYRDSYGYYNYYNMDNMSNKVHGYKTTQAKLSRVILWAVCKQMMLLCLLRWRTMGTSGVMERQSVPRENTQAVSHRKPQCRGVQVSHSWRSDNQFFS